MKRISFDTTKFSMWGFSPYIIMALIGCAFAIILYLLLQMKRNVPVKNSLSVIIVSFLGSLIGAKLLGSTVNLINSIINGIKITIGTVINSGIVYYGGLLGFLFFFRLVTKLILKKNMSEYKDILAVIIPLFHFFGRIGCFLAGCCYGKETDCWLSITYINKVNNTLMIANRIPIQLIEAGFNLMIFSCMLILFKKNICQRKLLYIYLICYGDVRFFVEFYRGDEYRGIYGALSISQYISLGVIIGGIAGIVTQNETNERKR